MPGPHFGLMDNHVVLHPYAANGISFLSVAVHSWMDNLDPRCPALDANTAFVTNEVIF